MRLRILSFAIACVFSPAFAWSVDLAPVRDNTISLAFQPSSSWSATVTLTASKDNSIFASDLLPNGGPTSNGGGAGIFVGTSGTSMGSTPRRGLLEFDVASVVPAGATITSAKLTMHLGQANQSPQGPSEFVIDLHRLAVDWGEGTAGNFTTSISGTGGGSPASPGDATWTQRFHQQANWTHDGAEGDYTPAISSSALVGLTLDGSYSWLSTPTLVSDIQNWLDNPSSNFGWILINQSEGIGQTVRAFYSRNATEKNNPSAQPLPAGWNPSLEVTFTSISEPSGDYNGNGKVDAADYVLWQKTFGQPALPAGSGADGDQTGIIDAGDYTHWRARFGNPAGGFASRSNVPEPAATVMFLLVAPLVLLRKWR